MRLATRLASLSLLIAASLAAPLAASEPEPGLAPLAAFVGKTWRSLPDGKTPDGQAFNDVARWDWAAGGHAVLIHHSLNDGAYGGTTLLHYDRKAGVIVCRYATTGGFYTDCMVTPKDGGIEIAEKVLGTDGGPTDVLSFMKVTGDRYTVESRMMMNGAWGEPMQRTYIVDPEAHVVFKP